MCAMERKAREVWKVALLLCGALCSMLLSAVAWGQALPDAGLQLQGFIPMPHWTTGGATAGAYDLISFNPVTKVLYISDRVNLGATAIDTTTWRVLGTIVLPGCAANPVCSLSGVQVAADLQKLIITDRDTHTFIYDLRVPGQAPAVVNSPPGIDKLDYDPLNHRIYVKNNTGPGFFISVIDLDTNTLLGTIPVAAAAQQPRFNPVDGMIYVPIPDTEVDVIDPQQGAVGAIVRRLPIGTGCLNAIDIDPTTDTAVMGCTTGTSFSMDLRSGTITPLPLVGIGSDIGYFNPHNRRWYLGGSSNKAAAGQCPKDSAGNTPVVAVIAAGGAGASAAGASLVGASCSGRAARAAGVDPFQNNIFVPTPQYPPDPNSSTTGSAGILVFHDPAVSDDLNVPGGRVVAAAHAELFAVGGSGVAGSVDFTLRRRNMDVEAGLTGLPAGIVNTVLLVTTTVGNEVVNCGVDGAGRGYCPGYLMGDPLIGGVVDVASGGRLVASGTISLQVTFPTFIPIY